MDLLQQILIRNIMTTQVVALKPGDTMADAFDKMKDRLIRHLPVVNTHNEVIGVFTDTDLSRACKPHETDAGWTYNREELNTYSIQHFMTADPFTLTPEDTLRKATEIMARQRFGCIPIVRANSKVLVGIISYIDLLKAFLRFI